MNFYDFWETIRTGGITPEGDKFTVHQGRYGEVLNISSPGNQNPNYNITKKTSENYFNILKSREMTAKGFRYKKSAYFENIFRYLTQ
jgi:hypothetical protein